MWRGMELKEQFCKFDDRRAGLERPAKKHFSTVQTTPFDFRVERRNAVEVSIILNSIFNPLATWCGV
jgi:hypothetical protein